MKARVWILAVALAMAATACGDSGGGGVTIDEPAAAEEPASAEQPAATEETAETAAPPDTEARGSDKLAGSTPDPDEYFGFGGAPELCDPDAPEFQEPIDEPTPAEPRVLDRADAFEAVYENRLGTRVLVHVEGAGAAEFFANPLCAEIVPVDGTADDEETPAPSPDDIEAEMDADLGEPSFEEVPRDDFLTLDVDAAEVQAVGELFVARFIEAELIDPGDAVDDGPFVAHLLVDPFVPRWGADVYSWRSSSYVRAQVKAASGKVYTAIKRSGSGTVRASAASAVGWTRNMEVSSSTSVSHRLVVVGWGSAATYSVYGTWRSQSFSM